MWGVYQATDCGPKPDGIRSKGERRAASREEALTRHPVGTQVKREFADDVGESTTLTGLLYGSGEPLWRIRSPDGDWAELNSQEMNRGRQTLAARHPFHQMENLPANIRRIRPENRGHAFRSRRR